MNGWMADLLIAFSLAVVAALLWIINGTLERIARALEERKR